MAYSAGFLYAMGWNRGALNFVGMWPEANDKTLTKLRGPFGIIWILVVVWLPMTASMTIIWRDLNAMLACFFIIGPTAIAIVKFMIFFYYRQEVRMLIEEINRDWLESRNREQNEAMIKVAKISRIISITSVMFSIILMFTFTVCQILVSPKVRSQPNSDPRISVGLLYLVYLPYNTHKKGPFISTWVAQCISSMFQLIIYAGFDTFFSTVVLHICGQLAVIGLSIRNLYSQDRINNFEFRKQLSMFIERHQRLNDLVDLLQSLFGSILLPQMILCTVVFCTQAYGLINSVVEYTNGQSILIQVFFMGLYLFYAVLHLFIYCYVGDYLAIESMNIGYIYYQSHWYNVPNQHARLLLIMDQRTQKPLVITASNFCVFSRNLFLKILKTSFGYLSMLMAVQNQISAMDQQ